MYQKIKAKFKANPTIFYACPSVPMDSIECTIE